MKAEIETGTAHSIVTLAPESESDKSALAAFMKTFEGRAMLINVRGVTYMQPEVQFYVQRMPRGD